MRSITLLLLTLLWKPAISQSYFYNTQQFGLQSTLLGGAVTAGGSDLSMVYYNPAALRYAKDKGFDLALFMPTLSANNYGDFFNSGNDLRSTKLSLNPSLLTYKTDIKDFDIVFSILQKDVWDNEISYSEIKSAEIFDKNESFNYRYKGDEKWFGLSTYLSLSREITFGVSQFWSVLSTNYRYHLSSEILNKSGAQLNFFDQNLTLDYSSLFSMVTKLGLSFDRQHDRFGVVVTSPNYQPARLSASFQRSTAALEGGLYSLANIVDFDLKPTFKNGWHFDLGYVKILRDSSEIWLNGSLFTGVLEHEFVRIERVQDSPLDFTRGIAAVANFSIGHARYLSPKVQFMGSIRTNFNAYDNTAPVDGSENIIVLEQDRLQMALGCKVKHKNSSFVLGLDWGFTVDNHVGQFERFPNIDLFDTTSASYGHQSFTLLLTYEFIIDSVGQNISKIFDPSKKTRE